MVVSNTALYSTIGLITSSFISSFILLIQRKWSIPDEYYTQLRDTSQPYIDYRFPRLIWYSLIGMVFYLSPLITVVVGSSSSPSIFKSVTLIDNTVLVDSILFGCWLYITILIWISKSYKLPNWWGGILNTHLFILIIISLNTTVLRFIFDVVWVDDFVNLPWMTVLPWFTLIFIQIDMMIMMITIPYDLPYLEKRSTSTPSSSSSSSSTTTTKVSLHPVLPCYNSSLLEYITFTYIEGYVYYISKCMKSKELVREDKLPGLPYQASAIKALKELNQTRGKSYSLIYRIYLANRNDTIIQYLYAFIVSTVFFAPPVLMKILLEKMERLTKLNDKNQDDHQLYNQLYIQVIGLIIAQMFIAVGMELLRGLMWLYGITCALRLRQMFNMEIFYKTLRRPIITSVTTKDDPEDKNSNDDDNSLSTVSTTGNIINLMSTDGKKISDLTVSLFDLWACPYEILIGFYLLYGLLGLSSFVGILVILISMPITHYVTKILSKSSNNIMIARDKRGNVVNEVLRGIRQIKFFAWENQWKEKILKLRDEEMNHLYKICICNFINFATWNGFPIFVIIAAFASFTLLEGKELTPSIAFTSMYIYSQLRFQLSAIPENIARVISASVGLRRIENYLQQEDIKEPSESDTIYNQSAKIGFENATIEWISINSTDKKISNDSQPSSDFSLKNIDIMFPKDELSLICGPTGSGKTLMLLGLLGEAICTKGSVYFPRIPIATQVSDAFEDNEYNSAMIHPNNNENNDTWILDHRVAYVSQSSWLQNGTIRENILFGLPFIEDRYHSTLWACGLNPDLEMFDDVDLTEIGERGITLSGGQKQRIALARAVYSRAKIILMDDVLSAVDAYTAKHLYENCLIGPLMKNRTRILVTHHIQMCIQKSSFILHLNNGQVTLSGDPTELRQTNALNSIIEEEHQVNDKIEIDNTYIDIAKEPSYFDAKKKINKSDNSNNNNNNSSTPRVLIEKEFREQGHIKRQLYKHYFLLVGGTFFWILVFLLVAGTKGLDLLSNWWLKEWSSIYETPSNNVNYIQNLLVINNSPILYKNNEEDESQVDQLKYYLGIYTIISLICAITNAGQYLIIYIGGLRASKKLFIDILDKVLHAPLRFFDTTPIGRILNRFSSDFDAIDSDIPTDTMLFLTISTSLIGIFVAILIGQTLFLVPLLITVYITVYYVKLFVDSSRECKRIESTAKSPLFSHFTETLVGISTIRAFGATQSFLQDMVQKSDNCIRPSYLAQLCNLWIAIIFACISCILIMIAGLIVMFGLGYHIDAGTVGFIFSYTLLFSDNSFWTSYRFRRVEVAYNSVERVVEFTKIEQESTLVTKTAPSNWPSKGSIEFEDLKIKYASDLDLVLKGVNFKINPGEKVGIVGPTGSGKSTLTLSIFRFLEAVSGKITIDDIDISTLALDQLRSNLTIIPQDPVLFSGTVRSNMDPFNEFSDASISEALSRMNLIPSINSSTSSLSTSSLSSENQDINQNIFENLNSPITEGGQNISAGQKQLICLAKSLLRRSKIVVMDEATSSVDFNTDRKIQKTIRSEFTDCTILCVAHRLFTVIHYDRVLVLDAGKVKEFDSPLNLISNPQSMFYKLCKNSGEFDQLLQAAQQN